jgi:hypothetical protein
MCSQEKDVPLGKGVGQTFCNHPQTLLTVWELGLRSARLLDFKTSKSMSSSIV